MNPSYFLKTLYDSFSPSEELPIKLSQVFRLKKSNFLAYSSPQNPDENERKYFWIRYRVYSVLKEYLSYPEDSNFGFYDFTKYCTT